MSLTDRATAALWPGGCSALQLVNVVGWLIFLGESSLGGAGKLGEPIGRVSDAFATLITPIGWAFSIWSAIFALTGALAITQALPSRRAWSAEKLGWWWAANTVVGEGLWTLAWVGRWGGMWVSAALLAFIVGTLAALYIRVDAGVAPLAPRAAGADAGAPWLARELRRARPARTLAEAVVLEGAISLYMGWTTAATILNVSIALVASGAPATGPAAAAAGVVMLLAAAALAVAAAVLRTDFVYAGALAWALAGIRAQAMNAAWPARDAAVLGAANAALAVAAAAAVGAALARARLAAAGHLALAPAKAPEGAAYAVVAG